MDFDEPIDRRGTDSLKWNLYANTEVLPMWVADMEFRAPRAMLDALAGRLEHGVLGYTDPPPALTDAIVSRMQTAYDWNVAGEAVVYLNGVVPALNMVCRAFAAPDQAVATPTPIYHPFLAAPDQQERRIIELEASRDEGRWSFPIDAFAEAAEREDIGVLLLCNPYNPVGRVLNRSELEAIVAVCVRHDITLCSDEIHCELILDDLPHLPVASLSEAAARQTVTLMAHTKTFNVAGIAGGFAIIQNDSRRRRFEAVSKGLTAAIGPFVYESMLAAFTRCDEWREALLDYLRGNRDWLEAEVAGIDGVSMTHVEGTYLAWIDVSDLGLDDPKSYFESFGVGFSPGRQFGDNGFVRLNFACAQAMLVEAVSRFRAGVAALRG